MTKSRDKAGEGVPDRTYGVPELRQLSELCKSE